MVTIKVDKKTFIKNVTIIIDTREQKNEHIISELDRLGVKYEQRKLDIGDYSFYIDDRDFSQSCVIERKADVNELYGNIMHDRGRIEKEFEAASKNINQFVLLVENCASFEKLKEHKLSKCDMERQGRKVQNIGEHCYNTLMSWQSGNRYDFRTIFVKDSSNTVGKMLEQFYYYWKNYREQTDARRIK